MTKARREKEAARLRARIAKNLRILRDQRDLSQTDIVAVLKSYGISLHQTAVSRIESGKQDMTPEILYWLSKHYNFSIDSYVSDDWKIEQVAEQVAP